MANTQITSGYPSLEEIKAANGYPSEERLKKGPVAVIECVQEIPCNPCEQVCPFGAIAVGTPMTNTPRVDWDKCVGCAKCIACCPGLAIFVVDKSGEMTKISFPFEYLPLPDVGATVKALNRCGEYVCEAKVEKVMLSKANDRTAVITISIPHQYADEVRTILRSGAPSVPIAPVALESSDPIPDDILVCRCEEVLASEIRKAIREYHATTITEVKRRTRAGMGLCQGRTCSKLVARILSEELNVPISELEPSTERPPVRPVTFQELAGE